MVTLAKIPVVWSGFVGGPGVSTFYTLTTGTPPVAAFRTFFDSIKTMLPSVARIQVPSTGVTVDSATGQTNGAWSAGVSAVVAGTGAAAYSAPTGAIVNWRTGVWTGGREMRGKTFIVPLDNGNYQNDGTLLSASVTTLQTAAGALIASAPDMKVYSRHYGAVAAISSASVPDKCVVLRSRRD